MEPTTTDENANGKPVERLEIIGEPYIPITGSLMIGTSTAESSRMVPVTSAGERLPDLDAHIEQLEADIEYLIEYFSARDMGDEKIDEIIDRLYN